MEEYQNTFYSTNNNVLSINSTTHNYTNNCANKCSKSLSRKRKNRKLFKLKFDFDTHGPLSNSDSRKKCPLIIIITALTIHRSIPEKTIGRTKQLKGHGQMFSHFPF